jgi:hypothetical protein
MPAIGVGWVSAPLGDEKLVRLHRRPSNLLAPYALIRSQPILPSDCSGASHATTSEQEAGDRGGGQSLNRTSTAVRNTEGAARPRTAPIGRNTTSAGSAVGATRRRRATEGRGRGWSSSQASIGSAVVCPATQAVPAAGPPIGGDAGGGDA